MSNGDKIVQEQLQGMIENLEATPGNEQDPQLIQLRVLSVIWRDLSQVRKKQDEVVENTNNNPSLIYLLRYQSAKTAANIFFIGMGLYIIYSFLDTVIGWGEMLGVFLP